MITTSGGGALTCTNDEVNVKLCFMQHRLVSHILIISMKK